MSRFFAKNPFFGHHNNSFAYRMHNEHHDHHQKHDHPSNDCCHHDTASRYADSCCGDKPKVADCCSHKPISTDSHHDEIDACCAIPNGKKRRPDLILWGSSLVIAFFLAWYYFFEFSLVEAPLMYGFATGILDLLSRMWWGLLLGFFFVGLIGNVPREFLLSLLGKGGTVSGIARATAGGLLLDLCSHGILMVGMQLYRRGASLGQVMAFLIASPWNSLSLTFILWALIGLKWTLVFILLSALIAIVSGVFFEYLVRNKILPSNPNTVQLPDGFRFFSEAKRQFGTFRPGNGFFRQFVREGWSGSKMVLKWILFGVILASALRTFLPEEMYHSVFGPTLAGLGLTLIFATILEVCSEGSTPIAADILTRAAAPGNAFAFLMAGVATDYTEIMAIKETTGRWKIAFFLPLVTLPQIVVLAYIMNLAGT